MLLMTDLGHDPDDAIALSFLIEHGCVPDVIILSPGFPAQVEIANGICNLYDKIPVLITAKDIQENGNYNPGKHSIFCGKSRNNFSLTFPKLNGFIESRALIIGPATNLGGKLKSEIMVFQGGYSPNSFDQLEKFNGVDAVPSFNPNGSKKDFNALLESKDIRYKYYVGKNVCHGYTKADLERYWSPRNKVMKSFFDLLSPTKAMHDVLAAQCFLNQEIGIWEQAKPTWVGGKLTTTPTEETIYSLIGVK